MITVSKLVGKENCAEELQDLKIWDMDVEEVMPAHLQGFFYRSKLRTSRDIAKNCANFIARSITEANDKKFVRNDRLSNFSISEPPYLSSELRLSLEQMSVPARRCTYFALLMGWPIERAVELTWKEINEMKESGQMTYHDAALDVIDCMPRHFKNNLVFWDQSNTGQPVALVGLRLDIETAFDCTYEELLDKFQTMVLVDPTIHADELKTIWGTNNG
ncbi:hypothetical protein [Vibrio alginolyticus]|uniref:hypothetical protein n=1 Tax=Vibrio alginolyticus TaxID=663 RepID=UPI00215D3349|nr:hypothetical protein [Vibrio alginolyticus]MCR9484066.1 hypothetical protein [Vibrio alginolyticus]